MKQAYLFIKNTTLMKQTFSTLVSHFINKKIIKNNLNNCKTILLHSENFSYNGIIQNTINIYVKNNIFIQLPKLGTSINIKNQETYININGFKNIIFGNLKCYYLHGMGYKSGNSINSLFFSMGRTQWDSISLPKGSYGYSIARKKSWRKRVIKDQLVPIITTLSNVQKENIISIRKKKSKIKKRKLRTRVKLLRNYHGLLFIYAMNIHQLNQASWTVQKMNIPNVYTGKGIHSYRQSFKPQARKLKSFFYKK